MGASFRHRTNKSLFMEILMPYAPQMLASLARRIREFLVRPALTQEPAESLQTASEELKETASDIDGYLSDVLPYEDTQPSAREHAWLGGAQIPQPPSPFDFDLHDHP